MQQHRPNVLALFRWVWENQAKFHIYYSDATENSKFSFCVNPIALRMAKTLWSFGPFECNRVKEIPNFVAHD